MPDSLEKQTLWTKPFIMVLIANIFVQMGVQTTNILVPKYAKVLGADSATVGLIAGLFSAAALLVRPFASPAFDILRKKLLIQVTLGIMILAFGCYAMSSSITMVMIGRLIHGLGVGTCIPLLLAFAITKMPGSQIAKGVSFYSLGQAFGQAVGPSLGIALTNSIGYRGAFIVAFVFECIAAVILSFCASDPCPKEREYRIRLDRIICKETLPIAVLTMLTYFAYTCISGFLAIYGGLCGVENIGLFFTVCAVLLFAVRPLTGRLPEKVGFTTVLLPSLGFFALCLITISYARTLPLFLLAAVFSDLGHGAGMPIVQALGMKVTPKEKSGVGSNTLYVGADIGQFAGAYVSGLIIDTLQAKGVAELPAHSMMYRIMVIPLIIAMIYTFVVLRLKKKY